MTIERPIPAGTRRELDRQESPEFYLVFLTLRHKALADPIRIVSDPCDFVLGGHLFTGFHFEIEMLSDTEEMPVARLSVQNVDRLIGAAVLASVDPVRLDIEVIAGSEFDLTVTPRTEIGEAARLLSARHLYLTAVEGDALRLSGTIRSWDYTQETWPALRATQNRFPGLYW
jgi:hypothetical protein